MGFKCVVKIMFPPPRMLRTDVHPVPARASQQLSTIPKMLAPSDFAILIFLILYVFCPYSFYKYFKTDFETRWDINKCSY